MTITKQDSNDAGLAIAEEATIGVLPDVPIWFTQEANTYSDFGGDPTLVQRSIIGTRKPQRGSITGIDPKAGFNSDFTKSNMARLLQGFFFADVIQKPTTLPINGAQIVITAAANSDKSYAAAAGLGILTAGMLLAATNFSIAANNGLKTVVTAGAAKTIVSQNVVDEGAPPANAALACVGFQFTAADAVLTYTAPGSLILSTTTKDLTTLPVVVGEWIFIGGDTLITQFGASAGAVGGYARIASIAANAMAFDKVTFAPATYAGTGKTIQIFFGNVYKDAAVAKRRTYRMERQLGSDADGIQTEQLVGGVANELTLNSPKKDKLNVDLSFIGLDAQQYAGTVGLAAGTRVGALGEDAYNTSSDVYRMRLSVFDGSTLLPTGFGYCTTATMKIANGASIDEAVGAVGGVEVSIGDFLVTGTAEFYFTTISAIQAIRQKKQTSWDMIVARNNAGWIYDMPYVELSGGLAKVEKNKPITLPVNTAAVQNANGYCALVNNFVYLPNLAMPTIVQT